MSVIGNVPQSEVGFMSGIGEQKGLQFGRWWMTWFNQAYAVLFAAQQSGSTANRPVNNLWIGRPFYDTTLSKPIYVNSVNPTVWKDASGSTV